MSPFVLNIHSFTHKISVLVLIQKKVVFDSLFYSYWRTHFIMSLHHIYRPINMASVVYGLKLRWLGNGLNYLNKFIWKYLLFLCQVKAFEINHLFTSHRHQYTLCLFLVQAIFSLFTSINKMEVSKPKWVNSIMNIIGVNSLRLKSSKYWVDYRIFLSS